MLKNRILAILLLAMIFGASALAAEDSSALPTDVNYIFKLDLTDVTNLNVGFYDGSSEALSTANFLAGTPAGEYLWQTASSISINALINALNEGSSNEGGISINMRDSEARATGTFYIYFGIDSKKKITVSLYANPLRITKNSGIGTTGISYKLYFTEYSAKNYRNTGSFDLPAQNSMASQPLSVEADESNCVILQKEGGEANKVLQGYYKVVLETEPLAAKPLVAYSGDIALRFTIQD